MVVFIKEEEGERSENQDNELSVVVVKDKPRRPPHNYMGIVRAAFRPFDTSSLEKICEQLYSGVLLREKKQERDVCLGRG
ncbi:hypothetical protein MLD38_029512 [Melastoma candidum]|uniref:Uncharacterized protein n=1 Tax=Melastoma candidum TaxID=119954 RepID=A0ACB9N475_9MYRT|nr:hypothetical protein MLD38_029512 [Melastoma candidum]